MDEIVKGVVLKTKDYKENDKLLSLFTYEKGKILIKVRGAKKVNSKLKSFCQLFCFADFELTKGKGGDILTGAKSINSFLNLAVDYDKYLYASFVTFIVDKICQSGEKYPVLFVNYVKCLELLNVLDISPKMIVCKFMLELIKIEGFEFNFDICTCGKNLKEKIFLNFDSGELVCQECKGINFVEINNGVLSSIKLLSGNAYEKLGTIKLPRSLVDKVFFVLKKDIEHRFEINLSNFNF